MSKFFNNITKVIDETTQTIKSVIDNNKLQNIHLSNTQHNKIDDLKNEFANELSSAKNSNPRIAASSASTIAMTTTAKPSESEMANFEKSLNNAYLGCFRDDPSNQKMKFNLGNVSNQLECMNKGRDAGVKYVALQNGNECYGSTTNDFMTNAVERSFCDIPCTNQATGKCGGTYFNQAYMVDNQQSIDHFTSINGKNDTFYWIILIIILLFLFC